MGTRKGSVKGGPKNTPWVPTDEMVDHARWLLGRKQYPSRCSELIERKWKISREMAYRVIHHAQDRVIAEFQGQGKDPLASMFLFFESIVSDGSLPVAVRINSAAQVVKMLGLERLIKKAEEQNDIIEFINRIANAQKSHGPSA